MGRSMMPEQCVLTLQCEDRPGLVADVATCLKDAGGNIVDAQQFNDRLTNLFFMRVEFELAARHELAQFSAAFERVASRNAIQGRLPPKTDPQKFLLLFTNFDPFLA